MATSLSVLSRRLKRPLLIINVLNACFLSIKSATLVTIFPIVREEHPGAVQGVIPAHISPKDAFYIGLIEISGRNCRQSPDINLT